MLKCSEKKRREAVILTFDVPVHNAMFMEDVNGCCDLFTVQSDDVFLQAQSGHLL